MGNSARHLSIFPARRKADTTKPSFRYQCKPVKVEIHLKKERPKANGGGHAAAIGRSDFP
jgi:hypothetical protein